MGTAIQLHMLAEPSETNYSATGLEALGVVWALHHFRAYLLGHKCIIYVT